MWEGLVLIHWGNNPDFFINPPPKVCCYWELGEQIGNIINNHWAFDGNLKKSHGFSLGTSSSSWNYSIAQSVWCQENTPWFLALKDLQLILTLNHGVHRAFPWVWSWNSSHYQLIDSATTYMHILKSKALFIDQSIDDPNTIF